MDLKFISDETTPQPNRRQLLASPKLRTFEQAEGLRKFLRFILVQVGVWTRGVSMRVAFGFE
jgi:hypothetical protein